MSDFLEFGDFIDQPDDYDQHQRAVLVTYRREFGGTAYARRNRLTKWVLVELRWRREARPVIAVELTERVAA